VPIYTFVCPECGNQDETVRTMADADQPYKCAKCGTLTRRDYRADRPNVVGTEKGETFWSESLAINPEQAAEHRRLFPDVKIDAEGRLGFDSVKQRSDYCTATGFEKRSQRKQII